MRCSGATIGCVFGRFPADRQLALCCRPKDGIDLALDDAARIHLHEDFRFLAGFDEAQLVFGRLIEASNPRDRPPG